MAVKHFQRVHDNKIPTEFDAIISNDKNASVNDKENNEEDDLIQLKGCDQITFWRFPQTTSCPAHLCKFDNGLRSLAINHFRRKHAKDHIFCDLCDKAVGAKCLDTFLKHYEVVHPNAELPDYFKKSHLLEVLFLR